MNSRLGWWRQTLTDFLMTAVLFSWKIEEEDYRWETMAGFTSLNCQDQESLSHREWFGLEIILKRELHGQTVVIEHTLPGHMWIMDNFNPTPMHMRQLWGQSAGVEESADVKLSMKWIHNELLRLENVYQIWWYFEHWCQTVKGLGLKAQAPVVVLAAGRIWGWILRKPVLVLSEFWI